jgi:hypothetical protein
MLVPITVLVPEAKVAAFYSRFGEFVSDASSESESVLPHQVGSPPAWTNDPDAQERAGAFWSHVTESGRDLLRVLISGALESPPRGFSPREFVDAAEHVHTKQSAAGTLGGVGTAIQRAGLPKYRTAAGKEWHFVWDWDGYRFSMTPEMAQLLLSAGA